MTELTLYSRSYCHLCEELLQALQSRFGSIYRFTVHVVDVDADPELLERYDELVPVLVGMRGGKRVELCHYHLDEAKVGEYLSAGLAA